MKIVRDKTAPIFRATFMDNVKIVQVDATLATANLMHVDFVMESEKASTQPTTDPSTQTAAQPDTKTADATEPKSLATVSRNAKSKAATAPANAVRAGEPPAVVNKPAATPVPVAVNEKKRSKHGGEPTTNGTPTTQPEEPPITIFWTGKLRVTPLDTETQDPPTHEDAVVTLEGEPAVLTHGDGHVECSLVRYHTQDSTVRMESSKLTPMILMKDGTGSVLRTPTLDYSGNEGIAILRGPSQADMVMHNEATTQPTTNPSSVAAAPTTQPQMMHASWTTSCRVFLSPGQNRDQMSIEHAEIEGDVTVDHPQVKGRSDKLDLAFDKTPSTKPASPDGTQPADELALKQLDADGKVHYVLTNDQKQQTLACTHLTLQTAKDKNNKTYAQAMNADGNVHAFDDTQDLKCGELAVKFSPSTRPSTQPASPEKIDTASMQVDSLLARHNVRVSTTDGNSASADQLEMATKDDKREVTLFGHPFAKVVQKDSTLTGPIIKFDPDTNQAYVVGAGMMHAVQLAQDTKDTKDKKAKPQPMDLSWAGNLSADGDSNIVDITEKIAISAKTSDGANNTASSERLKLTLMDDPRNATSKPVFPTTQKVKKDKSSPMATAGFGDTNFFKDKVVKTVYLTDNVQIASLLNDAKGKLLRRLYMRAPIVQYEMQDKIFLVPAPGQLLMQDVAKPTKAAGDVAGGDATPTDMNGATAFEWKKLLRYDETARRMTMVGDVHIEHESSGDSKPFTLRCQTIIADLEPVPPGEATTEPSTAPSTMMSSMAPPETATAAALASPDSPTTAPATSPTTNPSDTGANQKMRLKHVTATDQVEFISDPIHFEAASIDYDPNTHIMIAKGTERVRAELYDDKGTVKGSFDELHYNTQTGRIDQTIGFRTTVRK